MKTDLEEFLVRVADFSSMSPSAQNEVLSYHLQSKNKQPVQVAEINDLREQLLLPPYNTAHQFSVNSHSTKKRKARFVKAKKGYSLERETFEALNTKYGQRPTAAVIKTDLSKHLAALSSPDLKVYLTEVINCFESGYFRATIVLGWCAGYAILRAWLFSKHVAALNTVMSSWKTPNTIGKIEDFDEIGERKVLDTARTANVLTKEQHKQLVALLDQRNSFAHPSGRKVSAPIAEAYLTQIIDEVIVNFS